MLHYMYLVYVYTIYNFIGDLGADFSVVYHIKVKIWLITVTQRYEALQPVFVSILNHLIVMCMNSLWITFHEIRNKS